MQTKRARLCISGRVQGVFYRAFTRDTAFSIGLKGWVRNLPDGRVEAVFEGDKGSIEQAIKLCYSGPAGARVDDIEVQWEDPQEGLIGFQVRYF